MMNIGWSVFLLSVWGMVLANANFMHIIEGMYSPAVANMSVSYIGDNQVIGNITRIRQDCQFNGMRWFVIDERKNPVLVESQFTRRTRNLQQGDHTFGPMILKTDPDNLKNSTIRFYHTCNDSVISSQVETIIRLDRVDGLGSIHPKNN